MVEHQEAGGGSGFYGGNGGFMEYMDAVPGAGGSGYIANPLLKDKYMVGYNVETSDVESTKTLTTTNVSDTPISDYAKNGNGHARITNLNTDYAGDGLMLHYDGINNTISGHNSSATKWKDLSGHGFDGTINGCTWGDNYLSFDGIDDWVSIAQMNYSNPTIEIVFEYNSITPQNYVNILANWQSGGYGYETYYKNKFIIYNSVRGYIGSESSYNAVANKKYSLSGRYDNVNVILRENSDIYRTPSTEEIRFPQNNTIMVLGTNPYGSSPEGQWFSGKIYSVRIYNRALSDEEVYKNYIYDKLKFNIE